MRFSPHPVTLRQLQYILAVAERRSFRKAAEDCHVAQPSLSAQVAQAEEALSVQLFERDKKQVTVSAAGALLIERMRAILLAADALSDAARELSDPLSGVLRLGVIPTIAPYLLPEMAQPLREQFPRMTFLWTEEKTPTLAEQLSRGELDGAVLALESELPDLPHVVLGRDPFVFAAAPSHALSRARGPLRTDQLEGERVLLLDDGHCFRDQALSFCTRSGVEEAGYRATSLPTLVQMAAGGDYVTLLPRMAVPVENRRDTLCVRELSPKAPSRTIALVFRRGSAREETLRAIGEAMRTPCARVLKKAG
jgi:LysR family transcriptional regulator, hydrogen peroxide-inducible genes activator